MVLGGIYWKMYRPCRPLHKDFTAHQRLGGFRARYSEQRRAYIRGLRQGYSGTLQLQRGITTQTIGAAFVVCGTEIFGKHEGRAPETVIDEPL